MLAIIRPPIPFSPQLSDRHDQNTFAGALRQKQLMTLVYLWLVHRYKAESVLHVSPTDDNQYQTAKMKSHDIFSTVTTEVGQIIVADVNHARVEELVFADGVCAGQADSQGTLTARSRMFVSVPRARNPRNARALNNSPCTSCAGFTRAGSER
jgi:hypothetical protein